MAENANQLDYYPIIATMNISVLIYIIFGLVALSSAVKTIQKGGLPDGFYEVEYYGDGTCANSPYRFTYKKLDVCEQDVNDPGFRTITRCSASKGFETRTKCVKSCTEASCATTTSGPLGCIQIEKGYAIERTCGPAPASLVGHKWLATYKSDYTNCTGSILTFGEIADGSCFPVSATYGEQLECTDTTHTEVHWIDCDPNNCNDCKYTITRGPVKDINVCKDSTTLQCLQL